MDSYFPLDDNDNSLSILQKMPDKSMGYFILTGVNSRMGLTGVPGCATYTFYREINNYGSIIAITSQGTKIRTWDNGTLGNWQSHVLSSDLMNSNKLTLRTYASGSTTEYTQLVFQNKWLNIEYFKDGKMIAEKNLFQSSDI